MGPGSYLLVTVIIVLVALYTPLSNFVLTYIPDKTVTTIIVVLSLLSVLSGASHLIQRVWHLTM